MDDRKKLKLVAWLLILVAIVDVVICVMSFSSIGDMFVNSNINASTANSIAIGIVVFVVVSALLKIFIGSRFISQANGKTKGNAHVVLTWILLFVAAIPLIYAVLTSGGNMNWTSFSTEIAYLVIYTILLEFNKKVKED